MADIFVSYKREDREKVQSLVEALQGKGWSVWWDTRIGAGESWDRVIERELEAAGCVVVAWSKASVESDWVRQEAREGRERGCLIPVTIDGTRPPLEFRSVQAIGLAHWLGDAADPAFLDACAGVQRMMGTPNPPKTAATAAGQVTAVEWVQRGNAHRDNKDYDRAIANYTKAIDIDPRYARAYYNRGNTYSYKKDYDRAIADYTRAVESDPSYAWAYNDRGNAYSAKKDYDRAIADYTRAIEIDAKHAWAYDNRGLAYHKRKDYDRAIADYTRAIEIDPKHAWAYDNRGLSFEARQQMGDRDRAIADFRKVLEIDPGLATAKNALKRLGASP